MDCVGVPHHGWDDVAKGPPSADVAPFLAEVKGRRAFFRDKPLFTNLCYANPEVERKFIGCVADYAQSHPEIDFMHVWLADAANNFCECAECRKTRPSDRYVILLNGLDAELTRRALKTRIVFLAYLDMLWPPETERLAHPERFVFMFAPISRAYDASYAQAQDASRSAVIPPFRYNEVALPPTVAENMAFLWAWQPHAPCDSFCFDYHYYFGLPNDLAGMTLARVLHEDIRHLAPMGLNGLVSCQTLRSVLPSGFGMTVMGETLWNRECDLGALLADHFRAAFGEDGDACAAWLNKASEAIGLAKIHVAPPVVACAVAAALSAVAEEIGRFMPVIERNRTAPDRCRAASWRAMADHNAILCALMRTLEARARGDAESKKKHLDETVRLVWECEDRQSALLDGWLTRLMLRTKLLP
jgi:hypothetical protein